MMTSREVARVADETGFRPDVVEKVLRLHGILRRLASHPMTQGTWVPSFTARSRGMRSTPPAF